MNIIEVTRMVADQLTGAKFIACACMGPSWGDPYCPCEMKQKGLKSNYVPMTEQERKELFEKLMQTRV